MKNKLFKYFKASASSKVLIYKYMPIFHKFYFFVVSLSMVGAISTGVSILFINSISKWLLISLPATVILIATLFGLNRVLAHKAMKVIKQQYSINVKPKQWQETVSEIQIHLITEYLIENGIYSKWKLEKLIDNYREDEKKKKLPPLIAPGLLLAITLPNITQLITRVYAYYNSEENIPNFMKQKGNYSINLNISLFVVIFIFSIMIVATVARWNRLKDAIIEVLGFVRNRDGPKREALIDTLDNILYQLEENSNEEEYIQSPPHRQ
ncbi:hypothetical protein [Paenibacillus odorifer]|uniref:hypothetical protein n=1 Tax=Paenibacillus odorifer TaxID=189426 RepID=UPI000B9FCCA3|nr:hypothetical protein [Paenibacillus odorifer]OZQ77404.1 hypothetical protein CA596_07490 [Paenibacillus odorifer]